MELKKWMIEDIKMAFEDRKYVLDSNWIYLVDTETMQCVKNIWLTQNENTSLFAVFCKLLKTN